MNRAQREGGCHCGAIRFRVWVGPEAKLLDCNCSICSKKGFLHLIVDDGALTYTVAEGAPEPSEYRFGTGKARHLFCTRCGISPFYRPRSHPEGWSVNARCLDEGWADLSVLPFDGRDWERARAALDHDT